MEETHIVDVKVNPPKVVDAMTIDSVPANVVVKKATSTAAGQAPLNNDVMPAIKPEPDQLSKYRTSEVSEDPVPAKGEVEVAIAKEFEPEIPVEPTPEAAAEEVPAPVLKDIEAPNTQSTPQKMPELAAAPEPSTPAPAAGEPDDRQLNEIKSDQAKVADGMQSPKVYDTKEYYLPIGMGHKGGKSNGSHMLTFLAVFILLVGVALYLAVDAQLVKNSIKLPFELFK